MNPTTQPGPEQLGAVWASPDVPPGGWQQLPSLFAGLEEAGASSLWLTDHRFWPSPAPDALPALAVLATATSAATIGTAVVQFALHDPIALAKAASFAHALAPGRVVLGLGAGEHRGEFEAAGRADTFALRGHLLDSAVKAIERAWQAPAPYAMVPPGPVPIWFGGRSPAARRRAVHSGAGWIPHLCLPQWWREQQEPLDADLAAAGRSPGSLHRVALAAVTIDEAGETESPEAWLGRLYGLDPERLTRVALRGPAVEVAQRLHEFVDAGADHVVVLVAGTNPVAHFGPLSAAWTQERNARTQGPQRRQPS